MGAQVHKYSTVPRHGPNPHLANQDTDADEGLGRGQWGEGILNGKKNGVMGGGKGSREMLGRRQKIDCETITDILCVACLAS